MSGVLVLDRTQTRAALPLDRLLTAVRHALIAISRGEISVPPRIAARSDGGLLGAMPGYVNGIGLAAKLVSVFPGGHRGIVAYFDADTGALLAIMDAHTVTALRTAAAATVAMQALARPGVSRVAVIGTGTQAQAQVEYLSLLDPIELIIGARNPQDAEPLVAAYGSGTAAATIEAAVAGADVIFCCTSAHIPVIHRSWIAEGAHVSSVGGSDGPELGDDIVHSAAVFTEWRGAAAEPPPAGAWELQGREADVTLIGDVLDGRQAGRQGPQQLTVFKSTGHAALDVAAAALVYEAATASGLGSHVDL